MKRWVVVIAVVQAVLVIATSILLPLVFFNSQTAQKEFSTASQVIITVLAAVLVFVVPLGTLLTRALVEQRQLMRLTNEHQDRLALLTNEQRERANWARTNRAELLKIDGALSQLNQMLFKDLLAEDVGALANRVIAAVQEGTLECRPSYRITDRLLDSLDSDTICFFVHYTDNEEFFLKVDGHSLEFQEQLLRRIREAKLGGVRRLLVIGSREEAEDTQTWLLGLYHRDSPKHVYRVISKATFDAKRREVETIREDRVDVGIYGHHHVYVSDQSPHATNVDDRSGPHGRILVKESKMAPYRRLFDEAWLAGTELPPGPLAALGPRIGVLSGGKGAAGQAGVSSVASLSKLIDHLPPMKEVVSQSADASTEFAAFVERWSPGGGRPEKEGDDDAHYGKPSSLRH